MKTIKTS